MSLDKSDFELLHDRARKIESSVPLNKELALYWVEMTKDQLENIKKKIEDDTPKPEPKPRRIKVY